MAFAGTIIQINFRFDDGIGCFFTVQRKQSAHPLEEIEGTLPGSVSGVQRLIATPSAAASTGYHTYAQHPEELDDGKRKNDQHGVSQHVLQHLLHFSQTTLCIKQVCWLWVASTVTSVFAARMRYGFVLGKPGGVHPAGVVGYSTAFQLLLQQIHSLGLWILPIILSKDFTHRGFQIFIYSALVDKRKHQSRHFSCKDYHDNQKETAEAKFGFSERGAAPHQAEDEHHHANANDDGCRDHSLLVLDESLKVAIALDHVGTYIGQCCSGGPEHQAEEEQDGFRCADTAVHVARAS